MDDNIFFGIIHAIISLRNRSVTADNENDDPWLWLSGQLGVGQNFRSP